MEAINLLKIARVSSHAANPGVLHAQWLAFEPKWRRVLKHVFLSTEVQKDALATRRALFDS